MKEFIPHNIALLKQRVFIKRGYCIISYTGHPYNQKSVQVPLHRVVMENAIGRYLNEEEVVHHIDYNKENNNISNLMLLKNASEHAKLHGLSRGIEKICPTCKTKFHPKKDRIIYCSVQCSADSRKGKTYNKSVKVEAQEEWPPSKDRLSELIWELPSTKIGMLFGVSDRSVGNLCKKLEIEKPPRGYWTNKKATEFNKNIQNETKLKKIKGKWLWPSNDELQRLVNTYNITSLSKHWNMGPDTIRFKCKREDIKIPDINHWQN